MSITSIDRAWINLRFRTTPNFNSVIKHYPELLVYLNEPTKHNFDILSHELKIMIKDALEEINLIPLRGKTEAGNE